VNDVSVHQTEDEAILTIRHFWRLSQTAACLAVAITVNITHPRYAAFAWIALALAALLGWLDRQELRVGKERLRWRRLIGTVPITAYRYLQVDDDVRIELLVRAPKKGQPFIYRQLRFLKQGKLLGATSALSPESLDLVSKALNSWLDLEVQKGE
jgi:hypothetical protein